MAPYPAFIVFFFFHNPLMTITLYCQKVIIDAASIIARINRNEKIIFFFMDKMLLIVLNVK